MISSPGSTLMSAFSAISMIDSGEAFCIYMTFFEAPQDVRAKAANAVSIEVLNARIMECCIIC